MSAPIYETHITVTADDLDESGHMNNVRYLYHLQEAAISHWQLLADEATHARYMWVARRHELDYLAAAYLDEVLRIRTFISGCKGALSTRYYEMVRPADGKVVVQAHTQWCLLKRDSLVPTRIPAALAALLLGEGT